MEFMFYLIFAFVIGTFIFTAVKGIAQWNKNNHSPRLTVDATVVAKRTDVSHNHHTDANGAMHMTTSTSYYVTFQVDSGDRIEFHVKSYDYAMFVEGDRGKLSFQGTRFLGFERM